MAKTPAKPEPTGPIRLPIGKRYPTPQAQGPDSWVELRRYTWGERQQLRADFQELFDLAESKDESREIALVESLIGKLVNALLDRLHNWNWVNEQGQVMPVPKTEPELRGLYDDEIQTLFAVIQDHIVGSVTGGEQAKN